MAEEDAEQRAGDAKGPPVAFLAAQPSPASSSDATARCHAIKPFMPLARHLGPQLRVLEHQLQLDSAADEADHEHEEEQAGNAAVHFCEEHDSGPFLRAMLMAIRSHGLLHPAHTHAPDEKHDDGEGADTYGDGPRVPDRLRLRRGLMNAQTNGVRLGRPFRKRL